MDNIHATLTSKAIDCFIACETWFRDHHTDALVSIPSYCCFRDDRTDRIGGGVAIWSKFHFCPERIVLLDKPNDIEIVAVKLKCNLIIIGCYVPPQAVSANRDIISRFIVESVDSCLIDNPTFDVVLCGDFNRLNVDVISRNCNLVNLHKQATYGLAELDYILISENVASVYSVCKADPIDTSSVHHVSLLATPLRKQKSRWSLPRTVYDLRRSNIAHFVNVLSNVDWSFLSDPQHDLNDKCEYFHNTLSCVMNATISEKTVTFTRNTKPWITPLVKSLINDRWVAYRQKNFQLYNHLKSKVKKEIEKSKTIWVRKMKSKNIWKTANVLIGKKANDDMCGFYSRFDCIYDAAHSINQGFAAVFSPKNDIQSNETPLKSYEDFNVTETKVKRLLDTLPCHKASSDLPLKLYKAASFILDKPLTVLFRQSIREASVPNCWKISAVTPLPKISSPSACEDLRPISLLPTASKILERIILGYGRPFLLKEYGDNQFGFRPASSTTCALISLHDHITRCLDNKHVAGVLLLAYDFSKAFDRLQHNVIIDRLYACNMPPQLISWIKNYLHDRKQYVKIGAAHSSLLEVTSGIPQGSILGPFLFSVVIGSLEISHKDCHMVKYADDITLSIPIFKHGSNLHVSSIHEEILKWSTDFGLPLNFKKCKCLTIPKTTNCQEITLPHIERVEKLTILGVTLNSRCTWTDHINKVSRNAARRLYPLRILKPHMSPANLKTVYFGIMRSIIEYAAPLLIGMHEKDAKKLNALQTRFHRLLCGRQCRKECLPSITKRRENHTVRLYEKALHQHDHRLKSIICIMSRNGRLLLPAVNTTRRLRSFVLKGAMLFNEAR